MPYRAWVSAIVFAALLLSVNFGAALASNTVSVTEAQDGTDLTVSRGQILMVTLACTPGTGYSWSIGGIDRKVLRLAGTPQIRHSVETMPGSPALAQFQFLAAGRGITELELVYTRPWEHHTAPAQTFRITITVR